MSWVAFPCYKDELFNVEGQFSSYCLMPPMKSNSYNILLSSTSSVLYIPEAVGWNNPFESWQLNNKNKIILREQAHSQNLQIPPFHTHPVHPPPMYFPVTVNPGCPAPNTPLTIPIPKNCQEEKVLKEVGREKKIKDKATMKSRIIPKTEDESKILQGYKFKFRYYITNNRRKKLIICKYGDCKKEFTKTWSFLYHARMHEEERPYSCSKCPKTFSQKSNLTKHLKHHVLKTVDERKLH